MTTDIQTEPAVAEPTFNSAEIAERLWSHRQLCPNPNGDGWIIQMHPGDFVNTKVIDRTAMRALIALFAGGVDSEEMYEAVIANLNKMGKASWLSCEYEIRQILEGVG